MSRKFAQYGDVLTHQNNSGAPIAAGAVVVMGDSVGVALVDIPDGEKGSVSVEGVHELPKAAGTAWNQGDALDWDASAGAFTVGVTPTTGDVTTCAIAAAAAASADTTGLVKLANPGTAN